MNTIIILLCAAFASLTSAATSAATCAATTCLAGSECSIVKGRPVCCSSVCTLEYSPRCGSDGVTYPNKCSMDQKTCLSGGDVTQASLGECQVATIEPTQPVQCQTVRCGWGAHCEVTNGQATCVCPRICPLLYLPVCGSDGVTYGNECQLNVQYCETQGRVTKLRDGACGGAEGGMCGGIAGIACASGLVCVYANGTTTPPFPDASGTCTNRSSGAGEGEMCGGFAGISCASGLVCVYENGKTTPPFPDASGTCSSRSTGTGAGEGEMCGGIRGIICASDLVCVYENGQTTPPFPDAAGTCTNQDSGAGEGEMCGGIRGIVCASGLVCVYENGKTTPPFPDAAGTCTDRSSGAGEGEMCGGIRGIACASDLVCLYENGKTTPPFPDAAGTCSEPAAACSYSDWRSHYDQWPVSVNKKYSVAFGVNGVSGTLKQVINLNGNSVKDRFLRESVPALLNALSDFNYGLNSSQVIDRVKSSYGNNTRMSDAYTYFQTANNIGHCPL